MADCSLPLAAPDNSSTTENQHFAFSISANERSHSGLLRALCLRSAVVGLLAYGLYTAAIVLATSASMLPNRWGNTYPEAPHVYTAIRSAKTHRLYFPFTERPYVLQSYGPLFYEMYYWIARAVHADIDRFIFWARVTNFASFVLCGLLVFTICRRLGFSFISCACAATLPLGVPIFCGACVTTRPDMYFLAAMLASLLVAMWSESPGDWTCLQAGFWGGIAILIKQPGIALFIAVGMCWLIEKRYRQISFFISGAAVPAILMFGLLLLHGEHFLSQFLSVGLAPRSFSNGIRYSVYVLDNRTLLMPIGIAIIGCYKAAVTGGRSRLIALFTLFNWLIGFAGMPQLGAAGNYFFAGLLGCGLLVPFAIEFVRENIKFAPALLLLAVGLCYLIQTFAVGPISPVNVIPHAYQALQSFRILSDRPEFTLHGKDPDLLDPISIHMVELGSGAWSSTPIEQSVRSSRYDLVILACGGYRVICSFRGVNFFGPGVIGAINQNYSVFCTSHNAIVLAPRSRHVSVTPDMLAPALGAACETRFQGHTPDLAVFAGTQ